MPIEWFVTTASQSRIWLKLLSDDSNKVGICLLCRSTQLHATTSCRLQFATTCDSSYVLQSSTPYWKSATLNLLCTTLYYKVLIQYYSVLQSSTPVLLRTTLYYTVLLQCYSVLLQYCSVLQSTTPVLFCTTLYYSSTTPVLLCTTPVLLCTTKYYSSTTLYYKVLLQYYSVLQSTTPVLLRTTKYYSSTTPYYTVLLCTTKHYSSTTLYYKVLLQYYSVLQSTTPVLLCTTKYYSSTTKYYSSTTLYYSVLHSTTLYYSSTTLYYKLLLQYYSVLQSTTPVLLSWLIRVTYEMSFAMRGTTGVILQHHRILRLPRKMTVITAPRHVWNVIYNARHNRWHPPTSSNTAPATQNDCHDWSLSHMKRCLHNAQRNMCHSPNSPNTAPATKNDRPKSQRNLLKTDETSFPMRGRSEHDPRMLNRPSATRLATEVTFHAHHEQFVLKNTTFRVPAIIPNFTEYCACHEKWHLNFTKYCACHEKWISWLILVTNETLFTMRGATCVIVQTHQILRLPRKVTLELHQILRLPRKVTLELQQI